MSFRPVVPLGGYAGWQFLKRTQAAQQASFNASPELKRDTAYFAGKIGSIRSPDQLLADRRLLKVALGAYGLEADINARAFLKKVLDEGALAPEAFANRLADKRYLAFARAFGFAGADAPAADTDATPTAEAAAGPDADAQAAAAALAQQTSSRYLQQRFEQAVGESNPDLRLALEVERGLATVIDGQGSDNGRWYALMANQGLRKVVETALGLPSSLGAIDVDRQLDSFRTAARRVLGADSFAALATPETQDRVVRLFLLRSETAQAPTPLAALKIGPLRA